MLFMGGGQKREAGARGCQNLCLLGEFGEKCMSVMVIPFSPPKKPQR